MCLSCIAKALPQRYIRKNGLRPLARNAFPKWVCGGPENSCRSGFTDPDISVRWSRPALRTLEPPFPVVTLIVPECRNGPGQHSVLRKKSERSDSPQRACRSSGVLDRRRIICPQDACHFSSRGLVRKLARSGVADRAFGAQAAGVIHCDSSECRYGFRN